MVSKTMPFFIKKSPASMRISPNALFFLPADELDVKLVFAMTKK
jgi:hypothetical protein